MKICLTFICRDNEDVIEEMINSCFPYISYIVACDTGSKDNTIGKIKEAANKHNLVSEIYSDEWENFGHNRTLMMERAERICKDHGYDYILVMDSDEILSLADPKKPFNKEKLEGDVIMLKTRSGDMEYYRDRMFSTKHKWTWHGYAHEYPHSPTFKSKQYSDTLLLKLRPKIGNAHIQRNYDLLRKEDHMGNPTARTQFYLAQSARDLGKPEEAIEYYEKCLKTSQWDDEKYFCYYDMGRISHRLKELHDAIDYYMLAMEEMPERNEANYNMSILMKEYGRHNIAIMFLKHIVDRPGQGDLFREWAIDDYLKQFELAINYYWSGDYENSIRMSNVVIKCENVPENFASQNRMNKAYSEAKLIETGKWKKRLVIQLPKGYDGLGDHLFFSHLPELAKKAGFQKVFISNHNEYKTAGTKELVWKENKFVNGFTDDYGTYFDKKELFDILAGNPPVKGMNMLKQIAIAYGLYYEQYNGLPIIYRAQRKSVFDNAGDLIKGRQKMSHENALNRHLFYDGNWKHHIGIEQKDVDKFFEENMKYYKRHYKVMSQAADMGKALMAKDIEAWKNGDLQTYVLRMLATDRFVCLMSGGSVLAPALGVPALVIDNDQSNSYYKFPHFNTYLSNAKELSAT